MRARMKEGERERVTESADGPAFPPQCPWHCAQSARGESKGLSYPQRGDNY